LLDFCSISYLQSMSTILFLCTLHFSLQFWPSEFETADVDIPREAKDLRNIWKYDNVSRDTNSNKLKYRLSRIHKHKSSKKIGNNISLSRKKVQITCHWVTPRLCIGAYFIAYVTERQTVGWLWTMN
jgi:hypothetical protein